jgi:hypothetical protein
MKKAIAIYSIIVGSAVPVLWSLILLGGNIHEGTVELGFHLYSEFLMTIICLMGGILLLRSKPLALDIALIGHAMVIYSAINTAGYYGGKGENGIMVMLIILFMFSVISLIFIVNLLTEQELRAMENEDKINIY